MINFNELHPNTRQKMKVRNLQLFPIIFCATPGLDSKHGNLVASLSLQINLRTG